MPEAAPCDAASPSCKSFVVESWVCDRPVEVFPGQGLLTELMIVGDSAFALIIALCMRLVGEQLWGLLREVGGQESRHERVPLHPL